MKEMVAVILLALLIFVVGIGIGSGSATPPESAKPTHILAVEDEPQLGAISVYLVPYTRQNKFTIEFSSLVRDLPTRTEQVTTKWGLGTIQMPAPYECYRVVQAGAVPIHFANNPEWTTLEDGVTRCRQ